MAAQKIFLYAKRLVVGVGFVGGVGIVTELLISRLVPTEDDILNNMTPENREAALKEIEERSGRDSKIISAMIDKAVEERDSNVPIWMVTPEQKEEGKRFAKVWGVKYD